MVASWLVTHAQAYGISDVHYASYQWTALPAAGDGSRTPGRAAGRTQ